MTLCFIFFFFFQNQEQSSSLQEDTDEPTPGSGPERINSRTTGANLRKVMNLFLALLDTLVLNIPGCEISVLQLKERLAHRAIQNPHNAKNREAVNENYGIQLPLIRSRTSKVCVTAGASQGPGPLPSNTLQRVIAISQTEFILAVDNEPTSANCCTRECSSRSILLGSAHSNPVHFARCRPALHKLQEDPMWNHWPFFRRKTEKILR